MNKIIVALDVETAEKAREIIDELRGEVGAFKIGLQLFCAAGASFVRETVESGAKVFLDLKFHDIPNTVARASVEAARMGVWMFNLHAVGGGEMLTRAVEQVRETCEKENLKQPKIIGVTVLTSSTEETLRAVGIEREVESQVLDLARLSESSGLNGVVASPLEINAIRAGISNRDFLIVTPGIRQWSVVSGQLSEKKTLTDHRPPTTDHRSETFDDQKRVMTAREAVEAGADFLVVGRPILQAKDMRAAARKIVAETDF